MQREDSEGTTTSIPIGEQREDAEGRIRRASQPYPHRKEGSRDKRSRSSSRQAPTSCSGCMAEAGRFPNKE